MMMDASQPSPSSVFSLFSRLISLPPCSNLTPDQLLTLVNDEKSHPKQKLLVVLFEYVGISSVGMVMEERKRDMKEEVRTNVSIAERKRRGLVFDAVFSGVVVRELNVSIIRSKTINMLLARLLKDF